MYTKPPLTTCSECVLKVYLFQKIIYIHTRIYLIGTIQVLRNAVGGGGVSAFPEKSVTKVCGSTLLSLQGAGWGSNFQENSVT